MSDWNLYLDYVVELTNLLLTTKSFFMQRKISFLDHVDLANKIMLSFQALVEVIEDVKTSSIMNYEL